MRPRWNPGPGGRSEKAGPGLGGRPAAGVGPAADPKAALSPCGLVCYQSHLPRDLGEPLVTGPLTVDVVGDLEAAP